MSRLKRQRLDTEGHDKVTLESNDGKKPASSSIHNDHADKGNSSSLIVKSLPSTVDTEHLTEHFSQIYPIKHATVVFDKTTKLSKGFGFVTFADPQDAIAARVELQGTDLHGGQISLDLARPRHRRTDTQEQDSSQQDPRVQSRPPNDLPRKLIVRNLPWSIKQEHQVASLFEAFGDIQFINLPKPKNGLSPGFGFVVFKRHKRAKKALESMNGRQLDGRTLAVDWAVEKTLWQDTQRNDTSFTSPNIAGRTEVPFSESVPETSDQEIESDKDAVQVDEDLTSANLQNEISLAEHEKDDPQGNATTLFVRNVPFLATDESLYLHFKTFGPLKSARIVKDPITGSSKGTAFVQYYKEETASECLREANSHFSSPQDRPSTKTSILQDQRTDTTGRFTLHDRVLQVSRAVDRAEAIRIASVNSRSQKQHDVEKRRLYLLSEGSISVENPLYQDLSSNEILLREQSSKQRSALVSKDPSLCLSLTRLSVRNLPRDFTSKLLGALAREAVVGFAKDVKSGLRQPLSREEKARGGSEIKLEEAKRRAKGKGILKQAKIIFENREGTKVNESSGGGRSRGYGFIEYSSHRWALMGLRWLNARLLDTTTRSPNTKKQKRRLIVEFAIENSQVTARRQLRQRQDNEKYAMKANSGINKVDGINHHPTGAREGSSNTPSKMKDLAAIARQNSPGHDKTTMDHKQSDELRVVGRKRMAKKRKKT